MTDNDTLGTNEDASSQSCHRVRKRVTQKSSSSSRGFVLYSSLNMPIKKSPMMALSGIVAIIPYMAADPSFARVLFLRLKYAANPQRKAQCVSTSVFHQTAGCHHLHCGDGCLQVFHKLVRALLVRVRRHDAAVEATGIALALHFPPFKGSTQTAFGQHESFKPTLEVRCRLHTLSSPWRRQRQGC